MMTKKKAEQKQEKPNDLDTQVCQMSFHVFVTAFFPRLEKFASVNR